MEDGDRAVFFTRQNFQGKAWFLMGPQTVFAAGDPELGGRNGFGNTIASARLTPFRVGLVFHVVLGEGGVLPRIPGDSPSRALMRNHLRETVSACNLIWETALLQFDLEAVEFHEDAPWLYRMDKDREAALATWRRRDCVNVLVVDEIADAQADPGGTCCGSRGLGKGHWVHLATRSYWPPAWHGSILAHELGHFFELSHASADFDSGNLMYPSTFWGTRLSQPQVSVVHAALAREPGRARYRRIP